jgi:hypothetical protein
MWFFQHRRGAGFALKPGAEPLVARQLFGQDLQRDRPVLAGVMSLIHLTHAALPEQSFELVLAEH